MLWLDDPKLDGTLNEFHRNQTGGCSCVSMLNDPACTVFGPAKMPGDWVQQELIEVPKKSRRTIMPVTYEYWVRSLDKAVSNYGTYKTLQAALDCPPAQHTCPIFIFQNETPIYRWHKINKEWRKM